MERRDEIDILKALAIIGVVWIHIGAYLLFLYPFWSPDWKNLVILDQIWRFSVPLFVALSGYTLAARYKETKINLAEFFQRRVLRVLPLYFLWAIVSFSLNQTGYPFWQAILLGRADYHLYFVPMIIQLYLLFPFLLWLIKRFPRLIVAVTLVWQVALFNRFGSGSWSDQEQYLFFGAWLWYFILGIYGATAKIRGGWLWLVALVGGLWWAVKDAFDLAQVRDLIIATRFTKLSILIFSTGAIGVGLMWGKYLNFLPRFLKRLLVLVGRESYLIYLSHVLIVQLYFAVTLSKFYPAHGLLPLPVVLAALVASIAIGRIL